MRRLLLALCVCSAIVATGCGGRAGAEDSVRELYELSRTMDGLDSDLKSVSCADSTTPEPTTDMTFYDCTLEFDEGASDLWCVVEGSARTAPLPMPCTGVPAVYLTQP
jgi:hypothetical protein